MHDDSKVRRRRMVWLVAGISTFGCIGWAALMSSLTQLATSSAASNFYAIGYDVFKTIAVATSVGIAIKLFVQGALETTESNQIEKAQIKQVFPYRIDALPELLRLVKHPNTRKIDLCGLSLRDFLLGGGRMRSVWDAIVQRLQDEHALHPEMPLEKRFAVRLLLLDPKSAEGLTRQEIESQVPGVGLIDDVRQALRELDGLFLRLRSERGIRCIELRFYEHCPFSFLLLTPTDAFVEQYYYKHQPKHKDVQRPEHSGMPLLHFSSHVARYDELAGSFDVIWDKALPTVLSDNQPKTAAGIRDCRIVNIFRKGERRALGERQIETLNCISSGETVKICAISGKFYAVSPALDKLREIATPGGSRESDANERTGEAVTVRFALINPISRQAILRAIADSHKREEIIPALREWNWTEHQKSRLFQDTEVTIRTLNDWVRRDKCKFEVRLGVSMNSCALFVTPRSAFVEQYLWGRTVEGEKGLLLGGEFPVVEYAIADGNGSLTKEGQMISSAFDVIWTCFSISEEVYERNKEDQFQQNLESLQDQIKAGADAVVEGQLAPELAMT